MPISFEKRGNVGVIWVDNPPVNAISVAVRRTLLDGVALLNADADLQAGVLACRGRTFMAGADITEFGKPPQPPMLPETLDIIENAAKPIVAAIHGTALGGGLETALACHYRIALASAKVGLPEVKLGLLPGAGGTQRLPRLMGIEAALALIIAGDPISASQAAGAGIIDRVVEGDLTDCAVSFAQELVARGARCAGCATCPLRRENRRRNFSPTPASGWPGRSATSTPHNASSMPWKPPPPSLSRRG